MKNNMTTWIDIAGIQVEVVRKAIRHLHITIYPPDGRVRLAVPFWVGEEAVRLAVIERLAWIKGHREKFASQVRPPEREMAEGETHWYQGKKYSLAIREVAGREGVVLNGADTMELAVCAGSDVAHRRDLLDRWYRKQLKLAIDPLIAKWEPALGVKAAAWGVRKMRTRWGSCNVKARRLWFSLELAKKPPECLEYVVVHELVHLLERRHDARFKALMTLHLPQWRQVKKQLNTTLSADEPREL
jgi:predicted metal-dependent hydrolase